MDRRWTAAAVIGVVVATAVGSYVAGSRITSPAEVASRTAAPEPSLILVPVEERVLSTDVVTRGTGRFGSPQKLTVAASALKSNPGLIADQALAGSELVEGAVAASASGRPLFVLAGARPMSRDLGPGLSGDDVRQLEESLARLGFDGGPVDGVYDELTAAGVAAWYEASGYTPFAATDVQLADIRAREIDLASATTDELGAADAASAADAAAAAARSAFSSATRRRASTTADVDRARAEANAANAVADAELAARQSLADRLRQGQAVQRGTPAEIAAGQADVTAATANAAAVNAAGRRLVAEAQATLDRAPAKVQSTVDAANAANLAATAEVAARQAAVDQLIAQGSPDPADLAAAEADLQAAVANADIVRIAGVQDVADAQQAAADAAAGFDAAKTQAAADDAAAASEVVSRQAALDGLLGTVAPTPDEIANADSDVAIAAANRDVVILAGERSLAEAVATAEEAAADVTVKQAELTAAENSLANANAAVGARTSQAELVAQEADLAHRRAGVQVPADEVMFVATAPVRVSELLLTLGDAVVGAIMTVTDAQVHVDTGLAVEDAGLVTPGMTVEIDEPDLGIATTGSVAFVAPSPGTNGVDGFHVYADITVAAPPANLIGASVRLTIPVASTAGPVLAVPVSALTLGPDGSSRIQRQVDGSTEYVTVEAGLSADGFVELSAPDGSLHAGDLVVIGFEPGPAGGAVPTASVPDTSAPPSTAPATSNG